MFGTYFKTMTKAELKDHVGKFGMIRAGDSVHSLSMHGNIKEMDARGNIYFVDNDGYSFIYTPDQVITFEPKEFMPTTEKVPEKPQKQTKTKPLSYTYNIFFTKNNEKDYFIVEGDTLERVRNTAWSVLELRGLDFYENKVYSEKIR
jgi:hypothetical protein